MCPFSGGSNQCGRTQATALAAVSAKTAIENQQCKHVDWQWHGIGPISVALAWTVVRENLSCFMVAQMKDLLHKRRLKVSERKEDLAR